MWRRGSEEGRNVLVGWLVRWLLSSTVCYHFIIKKDQSMIKRVRDGNGQNIGKAKGKQRRRQQQSIHQSITLQVAASVFHAIIPPPPSLAVLYVLPWGVGSQTIYLLVGPQMQGNCIDLNFHIFCLSSTNHNRISTRF